MSIAAHRHVRVPAWAFAQSVFAAAVAVACAPPEAAGDDSEVVQTAHLRITTSEDVPICAGTGPFLERELLRIADTLELPLWPQDDKLDVRLGFGAVEELCVQHDPEDISGCATYGSSRRAVAAKSVVQTAPHELVHAVRLSSGDLGPPLVEEGLARILSGSDGYPFYVQHPPGQGWPTLSQLLELSYAEFDASHYPPSQSFVSWLWLTFGRESLLDFIDDPRLLDPPTAAAVFEDHFNLSLDDANQEWIEQDGPEAVWGAPCLPERTFTLDGPLEISGALDCDDPEILGAAGSMSVLPMCLVVPQTMRVAVSLVADHGRLSIVSQEACDGGAAGAQAYRDKFVDAGDILEEDIAGCRHRMTLSSSEPGFPATEYSIRIEPLPG